MGDRMPVRVIYRSRGIQLSLLAAMKASEAWSRAGLDPGPEVAFVANAADADPMLESGQVDFIFGSHVSPYLRFDDGVPYVYLGQTVNQADDVVATRSALTSLRDLRGRRVADRIDRERHSHGNRVLFLRREGVAEDEVSWVHRGTRSALDMVASNEADGAFLSRFDGRAAEAMGLAVHVPAPLPMVLATTATTLWSTVERSPELCRRLLVALRLGIAFFKREPEAMRGVMREEVGPVLGISDQATLDYLYERNASLLNEDLYPRAEAVANAFALAVRQRPGIEDRLTPHRLWDMHLLRQLDAANGKQNAR